MISSQSPKKPLAFLKQAFANPTPELARNSVCPSHYMAVVELYRTTHDERYLKLAEKFLGDAKHRQRWWRR